MPTYRKGAHTKKASVYIVKGAHTLKASIYIVKGSLKGLKLQYNNGWLTFFYHLGTISLGCTVTVPYFALSL